MGADLASDAEQGLDVARGVEDQNATKDKIYIPNRLFLFGLRRSSRGADHRLDPRRSARRSTDAVVHKLNALGAQLAEPAEPRR